MNKCLNIFPTLMTYYFQLSDDDGSVAAAKKRMKYTSKNDKSSFQDVEAEALSLLRTPQHS